MRCFSLQYLSIQVKILFCHLMGRAVYMRQLMNKGELELFDKFESNPKNSHLRNLALSQFKEPLRHMIKAILLIYISNVQLYGSAQSRWLQGATLGDRFGLFAQCRGGPGCVPREQVTSFHCNLNLVLNSFRTHQS